MRIYPLYYPFKCLSIALLAMSPLGAWAHVDWDRVNGFIPGTLVGLYHFDEHDSDPGLTLHVAPGLPNDRGLLIGAPSGNGLVTVHDVPEAIFEPHALHIRSAQIAESTEVVEILDGDLTIEFWFKWDTDLTSQRLRVGLRSGAKLEIARNTVVPASDTFGLAFTHGDFISAPGFTNWVDVGAEEGGLGEWRHIAVTIHSTGQHFDSGLGHDVYNTGSTARFWLNGHATGSTPHTVDLTGLQTHGDSKLRVESLEGAIKIDEVTIWRVDWSEDGTIAAPFHDGRGTDISSSVGNWDLNR